MPVYNGVGYKKIRVVQPIADKNYVRVRQVDDPTGNKNYINVSEDYESSHKDYNNVVLVTDEFPKNYINVNFIFSGIHAWTLGYNGVDVFGQLTNAWEADAEFDVYFEYFTAEIPPVSGWLIAGNTIDDTNAIVLQTDGNIRLSLSGNLVGLTPTNAGFNKLRITRDAVNLVSIILNGDTIITGTRTGTLTFDYLGRKFVAGFLDGQLHKAELDSTTPANSIRIDNRIQSVAQPTDFNIYNTLKPALGSELAVVDSVPFGTNATNTITNITNTSFNMQGDNSVFFGTRYLNIFTSDLTFRVEFDAIVTSGAVVVKAQAGNVVFGTITTSGHYILTASPDTNGLEFSRSGAVTASFTNISVKETNIIGTYSNGTYQPLLQGGGSAFDVGGYGSNVVGKSQQFNGNRNDGGYTGGVEVSTKRFTAGNAVELGSWHTLSATVMPVGTICASKTGAVVKSAVIISTTTIEYTTLLGTDAMIQAGFEYPNVFRVLQDIGGTDSRDEWFFYDNGLLNQNGQPYPWQGAVFGPELATFSSTPFSTDVNNTITNITNTSFTITGDATVFFGTDYIAMLNIGSSYTVEFDVVVRAGELKVQCNNPSGVNELFGVVTASGAYSLTATADGLALAFARRTGGQPLDMDITNISVKEIL